MNQRDKASIIRRYDARLKEFGPTGEALASGTEERRVIRFSVLCDIGRLEGKRVLDVGCGLGDLLGFLKEAGTECDYTGFDINPKMVEAARKRYPEARFQVVDILKDPFPDFDYIVSTNSFNNRLTYDDNYEFIRRILGTAYEHVKEGVAVDFLTSSVDFQRDYAFYYEPEKVFAIAKEFTRRVCLRHDYPLFEFCMYMYRDVKFPYAATG